jgi:enediyne biosynthesis protein E4
MYKQFHYCIHIQRIIIKSFVLFFALFAGMSGQATPLPNGTRLTISPGVIGASDNCLSGSCYKLPGQSWIPLDAGIDGGLIVGKNQLSGGQEQVATPLTTPGDITLATKLLFNTVQFTFATAPITGITLGAGMTDASLNFFDDQSCSGAACIGKTQLGTLHAAISSDGGYVVEFGSDGGCNVNVEPGLQCTNDELNGILVSNWVVNPDRTYSLDYTQVSEKLGPQFFYGVRLSLHLEGVIEIPSPFSDQAAVANINHLSLANNNFDTGGGAAWIDYNNDNYPDLFVPNTLEGGASWFYHNNGDGTFTERAAVAGVTDITMPGKGAVVGDYDGDGCDDLFVINGRDDQLGFAIGNRRNTLYRNNYCDSGALTFTDVTETANMESMTPSSAAAFGDVNNDGYLDLYIGNYLLQGNRDISNLAETCHSNSFYLNNGNGSFTSMAVSLGIDDNGCALAVAMTDFDQDGDLDIYVSNDFSPGALWASSLAGPDIIYENTGTLNGIPQFSPAAVNLTDAENGMGIAIGDYDNDLDLDYYTTSLSSITNHNILNQNQGDNTFLDMAMSAGVNDSPLLGTDPLLVGWGAVFFDMDHDGYLDLYKANGMIGSFTGVSQPNRLFHNKQDGTFNEVGSLYGVNGFRCVFGSLDCAVSHDQSRGVAIADYDQDGDVDIFVVNTAVYESSLNGGGLIEAGVPRLYRNDNSTLNRIMKVILRGRNPNHRGIGSRVILRTADGMQQMREVHAGSGHGSSDGFPVHFGLGQRQISNLEIQWPNGCVQQISASNIGTGLFEQVVVDETECVLPPGPALAKISPNFGNEGDTITVSGQNLGNVVEVRFGNVAIRPRTVSPGVLTVDVPAGVSTGNITLVDAFGSIDSSICTFKGPVASTKPWISKVNPVSSSPGNAVFINGQNLQDVVITLLNGAIATPVTTPTAVNVIVSVPASASPQGLVAVATSSGEFAALCNGGFAVVP